MDMATRPRMRALPVRVAAPAAPFRTDIQALRAIAVLAVVLNHLSPSWLSGGYVGVDVFFVISGFLITTHLDKEIVRTGRVRLGAFYARRVRRLLPAALLVLGVSIVAAYFLLPYPRWSSVAQETVASATYWENWLLAAKSVDYSAANAQASLAQHYWSLSVEEQFYLVWPLLLLFLRGRRLVRVLGVGLVGAASLAFSVYYTSAAPKEAYFVTPARAWEFALGALVALCASRLVLPRVAAGIASFAGFVLVIGSAALFDMHMPFPGYLAVVPTVGTALVIVSGAGRQWHTVVTASRPVQLVGDVSYSLYLWHWPLIVLAPFVLRDVLPGGHLTRPYLVGVLVASLLLAYLSKVLVEDVGRRITRRTWVTFTAMVVGMALAVTGAETLQWTYGRHVSQAERVLGGYKPVYHEVPCHAAAAMDNPCPNRFGPADVPVMGPANQYYFTPPPCVQGEVNMAEDLRTVSVCDFSQGDPAAKTVWLVGDSHAQHWQHALFDLAREHRWVLKLGLLGGCPFAAVEFAGYYGGPADDHTRHRCMDWTRRQADLVAADKPDMVFTSFFARAENPDDGSGRSQTEQYRTGLEEYWRQWSDAGSRVVVLADAPLNGSVRDENCVALNPADPMACAVDRSVAQPPDPLSEAARTTAVPRVTLVDLTRYFCDERKCYAVVGNVAVYYDHDHMNLEFGRSLKPMIAKALGM
jgi:peptidoglycan/LPS O-acetylase OafA/YrhL